MAVRIPGDHPDLASALAAGADDIIVAGVVVGGLTIDRPLRLRGENGAVVRGGGLRVLVLEADVEVSGLRIENPDGKGITVRSGAPLLRDLRVSVSDVGLAFDGGSRALVQRCAIERSSNGVYVGGRAAPEVDGLSIIATGGGMVFRQAASGSFRDVQIVSGAFAAVETNDEATPEFERLHVHTAGTGGLFLHGQSRPGFRGVRIDRSGLSSVEIAEDAAPRLEGIAVEGSGGSGFYLHGSCAPRIVDAVVRRPQMAGVEAKDAADPTVDGLRIEQPLGSGLFIHGDAGGTWMEVVIEQPTLAGIEVSEKAHPELERVRVWGGAREGLRAIDQARVEAVELRIELCLRAAVAAAGAATLALDDLRVDDCRDSGLSLSGASQATLRRATVQGTDGAAATTADSTALSWRGGAADAAVALIAGGLSRVTLSGVDLRGEVRVGPTAVVARD